MEEIIKQVTRGGMESWLIIATVVVITTGAAFAVHKFIFVILGRLASGTASKIDDLLVRQARWPVWMIIMIFAILLVLPPLQLSEEISTSVTRALSLLLTIAVGWLIFNLTRIISEIVAERYDLSAADNLRAREIFTRVRLLQRVLAIVVVLVTASVVLMAIPAVRQIGITLFASAGVAGIVAGFAARPVLSNLIAGVQLALTQPVRIDDVVIVEGEWGRVEEMTATFVVVRIWDMRRLILPLSYFIETPFENWTRTSAEILGTVFVYTDYTIPVPPVREELYRILENSDLWDGKVWGLQVTNATERTLELRALMGARNASDAWDLRCYVREELVGYLQREFPQALPRLRTDFTHQMPALDQ